jgi:hypothetical protein
MSFNNNNDAAGSKRRGEEGVTFAAAATKVRKTCTGACVDRSHSFVCDEFSTDDPEIVLEGLKKLIELQKRYSLTEEEIARVAREEDGREGFVRVCRDRRKWVKALQEHVDGLAGGRRVRCCWVVGWLLVVSLERLLLLSGGKKCQTAHGRKGEDTFFRTTSDGRPRSHEYDAGPIRHRRANQELQAARRGDARRLVG